MSARSVQKSASPENVHRLSVLRDLYEGLLPPRQREIVGMRLDEDLSLSEMAERLSVSRQACEDALKRAEKALVEFEERIGMHKRLVHEEKCVGEAESALLGMADGNWPLRRDLALKWLHAIAEGGETDNGV